MTDSEKNAIREAIRPCWNIDPGALNADTIIVQIRATVAADGRIERSEVVDAGRLVTDPAFRRAAEGAQRALQNPRCNPLPLPREKLDQWRTITFSFNPKDMF